MDVWIAIQKNKTTGTKKNVLVHTRKAYIEDFVKKQNEDSLNTEYNYEIEGWLEGDPDAIVYCLVKNPENTVLAVYYNINHARQHLKEYKKCYLGNTARIVEHKIRLSCENKVDEGVVVDAT